MKVLFDINTYFFPNIDHQTDLFCRVNYLIFKISGSRPISTQRIQCRADGKALIVETYLCSLSIVNDH